MQHVRKWAMSLVYTLTSFNTNTWMPKVNVNCMSKSNNKHTPLCSCIKSHNLQSIKTNKLRRLLLRRVVRHQSCNNYTARRDVHALACRSCVQILQRKEASAAGQHPHITIGFWVWNSEAIFRLREKRSSCGSLDCRGSWRLSSCIFLSQAMRICPFVYIGLGWWGQLS